MKTILVPTDFSENAWNAIEFAMGLFKDVPCNFYILHVGRIGQSGVKGNSFTFPTGHVAMPIKKRLDRLFQRIKHHSQNKKHRFIALQDHGNLINAMRKVVDDKKIDLIVMGTKGAAGVKEAVVGSNTGDVITKIKCNVLVVPENADYASVDEIAFPTDYNIFYTHTILESMAEMLRLTGASISVLNVCKPNTHLRLIQEQHQELLFDYLSETFPNRATFHSPSNGNIIRAIQQFTAARKVGLLIMVAKNLNFLQQLLFDTTIEKLSFHTTIPILALHE